MYIKIDGAKVTDFTHKKIILFGASSTGIKALEEFERVNAEIVGFCDNNHAKRGTTLAGYQIYAPEDIKAMTKVDTSLSIMITSTYEKEILEQLKEMNIKNVYVVHMGVLHDKMPFEMFSNKILNRKTANQKIINMLSSDTPFFIGRLGSNELEIICNYKYFLKRIDGSNIPYTNNIINMLCDWAGFFPSDYNLIDRFCELYLDNIKESDLLWCMWQSKFEDKIYHECCPHTELTLYDETGYPIYDSHPWTSALAGKKVLVIHPFEESIIKNYKNKYKLFANKSFLPNFELITLKAIQTVADNKDVPYENWFEALEVMKQQMEKIDFDVALIGAGAYGFPLGAYAKELGKQALHIGGMLQLYFGIRGKYYDQFGYHNEYWTRPLKEEKPRGFQKVEAGRYW